MHEHTHSRMHKHTTNPPAYIHTHVIAYLSTIIKILLLLIEIIINKIERQKNELDSFIG